MAIKEKYSLALDYHENSKLLPNINPYDSKTPYKIYPNAKTIELDKNDYGTARQSSDTFLQSLLLRKSTHSFTSENINISTLSKLLSLSFGLRNDFEKSYYRTYPSAGGRYPNEVYVVIMRSDDMEKGIYHYNVCDNTLELIKSGDYANKVKSFYSNQDTAILTDYPCLILFSMVFRRTMEKYGERGYRFMLLDAGHMGQNLYLVATYLKLGAVALGAGGDNDNKLDDLLGLIHTDESAFYGFVIGHPGEQVKQSYAQLA